MDMFDKQGKYISQARRLQNFNVWGEPVPKSKALCEDIKNWLGNETCNKCPERNIPPCKDEEENE